MKMYNNCPLFFNLNVDYQQLQRVIVNYLKDDVQKFIVKDSTNSYNCICLQDVVGRVKDIKFITRDNNVSCTCDVQIFDKDVQQFFDRMDVLQRQFYIVFYGIVDDIEKIDHIALYSRTYYNIFEGK